MKGSFYERDQEGKVTHFQGVVLDITERKRSEEKLKKSPGNAEKC